MFTTVLWVPGGPQPSPASLPGGRIPRPQSRGTGLSPAFPSPAGGPSTRTHPPREDLWETRSVHTAELRGARSQHGHLRCDLPASSWHGDLARRESSRSQALVTVHPGSRGCPLGSLHWPPWTPSPLGSSYPETPLSTPLNSILQACTRWIRARRLSVLHPAPHCPPLQLLGSLPAPRAA